MATVVVDGRKLPLSSSQESLFFLYRLDPASAFYNIAIALRLRGALNVDVLQRCLDEIAGRHGALRATFTLVDGRPVQIVGASPRLPIAAVDLGGVSATNRVTEAVRLATEDARRPFELQTGPPARARLFRLTDEDHVLVVTIHHIVSDGTSMLILVKELRALYAAFSRGAPSPLAALPLEYADYCRQQGAAAPSDHIERDLAYWTDQLRDAPPFLELHTDRVRPAVSRHRGARHSFRLDAELARALRRLAGRHGATPFMAILAALESLLHRYTGQDDILVGAPVSRRVRRELRGMIGYFVNPVVMRARLGPDLTFAELLNRTRLTARAAYAHAEAPFDRVVQALRPARVPGCHPLFQVFLAFEHSRLGTVATAGWRMDDVDVTVIDLPLGTSQLDLALCAHDRGDHLDFDFEFDADLFDPDTIARMASHFAVFLHGAMHTPDRAIARLPLMTSVERRRLVEDWNDTRLDVDVNQLAHALFERQADRTPDAIALVDGERHLTYAELERLSNVAGHALRALGVEPDELVGVWAGSLSIEVVVNLLAIVKAGGAWVALDPAWPTTRVALQLDDLGVRYVVGAPHQAGLVPHQAGGAVAVDLARSVTPPGNTAQRLAPVTRGDHLAYAISTSGSTGRPQAVGITHANAVAFLHWARTQFRAEELAGVLATTSPIFDCVLFELFAPLSWGGTAILAPTVLSAATAAEARRITLLSTAPSIMAELLRRSGVPGSVRTVNLAGESMSESMPGRIFASSRVERVYNFYGPSETTTYATGLMMTPEDGKRTAGGVEPASGDERRPARSIIGRPIANVRVYILRGDEPVPVGVAGELCIGGAGVARGYINRLDLTAAAFVPDPFAASPGGRIYRTGDMARYLPDGTIQFLGRRDGQVKIRGLRVELGEVEAVLSRHPAVLAAVVDVDRPSDVAAGGDGSTPAPAGLVAWVVPRAPGVDPRGLRDFLARQLPSYMVPRNVLFVDALPTTVNGKVDRRALPAPVPANAVATLPGPCDYLELALLDVWQAVLGRADIGRGDDFFDLGGDSLLLLAALSMIGEQLNVEVPVETFVANPTIERLGEAIRRDWVPVRQAALVRVSAGGDGPPLFLVHGGSGDVAFAYSMVRTVDFGRPVYGLRSVGRDGCQEPLTTVGAMAARYLKEVKQVAPAGPYVLSGNCMGGLIAYEMAQSLHAQGEEVGFLGLIETVIPGAAACHPYDAGFSEVGDGTDAERLIDHRLTALRHEYAAIRADEVIDRDLAAASRGGPPSFFRRWVELSVRNDEAARSYVPRPYPGRVTLFADARTVDLRQQWERLAGGRLDLYHVGKGAGPLAMRVDMGGHLKQCLDRQGALAKGSRRRESTR